MAGKLKNSEQIRKLAQDLALQPGADPVAAILEHCHRKVNEFRRGFKCDTLSELLAAVAGKVGTIFIEVHTDAELQKIKETYVAKGETRFALLDTDLINVYAITYKRINRRRWEPPYISIIDCRGERAPRSYFSKWHEVAHLLTLTDQRRLVFTRSHRSYDVRDPEEALMEVIAGEFGFMPEIIRPHTTRVISFEEIDRLRIKVCPEASRQAALIGIVKAWRLPCVLIEARLGYRKEEERSLREGSFDFAEVPAPVLRAVHVTANDAARSAGIFIYENMRIPDTSVIQQIFNNGIERAGGVENLKSWKTRDGSRVGSYRVTIEARRYYQSVQALITLL